MLDATINRQRIEVNVSDDIQAAFDDYLTYDEKLERKYGRDSEWDARPGEKAARQRKFNRFYRLAEKAGYDAAQLTAQMMRA